MNDDDIAKTDEIAAYLEDIFPDAEMERHINTGRGLSCYYLNLNARERMVLKITDECIMDKKVAEICNAIERRCIQAMEANKNQDVVLFNDFHIEVKAPQ